MEFRCYVRGELIGEVDSLHALRPILDTHSPPPPPPPPPKPRASALPEAELEQEMAVTCSSCDLRTLVTHNCDALSPACGGCQLEQVRKGAAVLTVSFSDQHAQSLTWSYLCPGPLTVTSDGPVE